MTQSIKNQNTINKYDYIQNPHALLNMHHHYLTMFIRDNHLPLITLINYLIAQN